jgi:hypothetical protein
LLFTSERVFVHQSFSEANAQFGSAGSNAPTG